MGENRKETCTYYNVPSLNEAAPMPAAAVGIAVIRRENMPLTLRFIIRRDRNIRISSFTLVYRFSGLSIKSRDTDHPFFRYVYDKPDINDKDYILLKGSVSEDKLSDGMTAVISSVTLENGEVLTYQSRDYDDPANRIVGADTRTAERPLAEFFAARAVASTGLPSQNLPAFPAVQQTSERHSVSETTAVVTPRRKKKLRRKTIDTLTPILISLLVVVGIVLIIVLQKPPTQSQSDLFSQMLDEKRYSEAYYLVKELDDSESLQGICEIAASYYLSVRNYESAYLYASAAPEPFDHDVIDKFADYLISQNRQDELYDFLKDQEKYAETLQKVCESAVERFTAKADYRQALLYARYAPESLEKKVFEAAAGDLVRNGEIFEPAFNLLEQLDDGDARDAYIKDAAVSLAEEGYYTNALIAAEKIQSQTVQTETVLEICISGMKFCTADNRLSDAAALFHECSGMLDAVNQAACIDRLADYCFSNGDLAGNIFYRNFGGADTSSVVISAEEESIRQRAEDVYFLLTAEQKRAYHANPFSIYKEVFLIEDGVMQGKGIENVVSVSTFEYQTVVLRKNGTVAAIANDGHNKITSLPKDNDIVQIAAGLDHVALLHNDGTVTVAGSNAYGQGNVSNWQKIVRIAAGADFTVGLQSDGTLVACGSNLSGQCDIGKYENVIDIAACDQSAVLLFADGSVKVVGDISMGLRAADSFTDIRRIRAAAACIIAEKEDGTYVMAHGSANADNGFVGTWKNMKHFAAGSICVGAVDASGNMKIEGEGKPVTSAG